jgi:hypothetical protein
MNNEVKILVQIEIRDNADLCERELFRHSWLRVNPGDENLAKDGPQDQDIFFYRISRK